MIRSQAILVWQSPTAGGQSPLWTSPANFVTLVKSAHFEAPTVAATVILLAYNSSPAIGLRIFEQQLAAATFTSWDGWIVLNPGQGLYVVVNGGQANVWVSGAVLAGPNQFPPATN